MLSYRQCLLTGSYFFKSNNFSICYIIILSCGNVRILELCRYIETEKKYNKCGCFISTAKHFKVDLIFPKCQFRLDTQAVRVTRFT